MPLISQNCTSADKFVYHCLPNSLLNMLVEVGAPTKVIVGKHYRYHLYVKILTLLFAECVCQIEYEYKTFISLYVTHFLESTFIYEGQHCACYDMEHYFVAPNLTNHAKST